MSVAKQVSDLSVLVLEENDYTVSVVKSLLRPLGVKQIFGACRIADALCVLQNESVDLAVMEYRLDGMSGPEFVRMIRTAQRCNVPQLPIVMLSGFTARRQIEEARDAGVNEVLCKPVSAESLSARLLTKLHAPRPYMRSAGFASAHRLRHNAGNYDGPNRRITDCGTVAPDGPATGFHYV